MMDAVLQTRNSRRANCRLQAIAFDENVTLEVTVTNMSATGCRIEGPNIHWLTGRVTIDVLSRGLMLAGEIAWQKGRQMGVRFILEKG